MKRLIIRVFAIAFIALISPGSYAQSVKEDTKSLITRMNKEMMSLVISGRYEAMGKYYDMNVISLPNYRAVEKGYKLILNNNLGRKQAGYQVLDGEKVSTDLIIGEDMIVDIGTYTMSLNFPGLVKPKVDTGKYLNVWKKDSEGSWRIVAETWNADKSPNAPAQSKGQGQPAGSTIKSTTGSGAKPE